MIFSYKHIKCLFWLYSPPPNALPYLVSQLPQFSLFSHTPSSNYFTIMFSVVLFCFPLGTTNEVKYVIFIFLGLAYFTLQIISHSPQCPANVTISLFLMA
jgi:hypothetical protein